MIGVTIFAAGCGGSASTRSGAASGSVPAKFRHPVELALEYSNCMRTSRRAELRRPEDQRVQHRAVIQNPEVSPTEVASPAYQSASAACAKYLPQQPRTPAVTGAANSQR